MRFGIFMALAIVFDVRVVRRFPGFSHHRRFDSFAAVVRANFAGHPFVYRRQKSSLGFADHGCSVGRGRSLDDAWGSFFFVALRRPTGVGA